MFDLENIKKKDKKSSVLSFDFKFCILGIMESKFLN